MLDFKLYKPTALEEWIYKQYRDHHIHCSSVMDLETIAAIFNIQVETTKVASHAFWEDDFCVIFLNAYASEAQKRAEFFHELCHPLKHSGDQRRMPDAFRELMEVQANLFQLYAALPFPMLMEIEASPDNFAKVVSEEFNLPPKLVQRRMEQISNRIASAKSNLNSQIRFKQEMELKKAVGYDFAVHSDKGVLLYSRLNGPIRYIQYDEVNEA